MQKTLTTCPYCGCGCTLFLHSENNKVHHVSANSENAVNQGALCCKGHFGSDFIHSPKRLTTPLIRKNGELTPASWQEALSYVAKKLTTIRDESGGDALAGFSSARCSNEENYLFQKLMRRALTSNSVDHCARL